MKKKGNFWKSLIPFLIVIAIQVAAVIVLMAFRLVQSASASGFDPDTLFGELTSMTTDSAFTQAANIFYGIVGLLIFSLWYSHVFVKPFRKRVKNYPSGFSFHTVVSLIFLAVGLQYVCSLVVDLISSVNMSWVNQYNSIMEIAGYDDVSLLLVLYTVFLAPIVEELVFRGLIFRYARHALPFWGANLWQAALFGVIHMNIVQGVYAFTMGIFLGWICRRGHGVKYSILLHILFNAFGTFCSGMFSFTTALSFPVFIGIGIALTAFGLWLFYTDFFMEPESRSEQP